MNTDVRFSFWRYFRVAVPDFDFSVNGVTSMSADTHKVKN